MGFARRLKPHVFMLLTLLSFTTNGSAADDATTEVPAGIRPTDKDGKPLNLDFEDGTTRDWTAVGDAFQGQPIKGDTVHARRGDMSSRHTGEFWVGSYERKLDAPQGTLTSRPFVTQPYATFLLGGGSYAETRIELIRKDTGEVFYRTSAEGSEDMRPFAVDLTKLQGKEISIRHVDEHSGGWGHLNFDDFKFHASKPNVPMRTSIPDVYAHDGLSPLEAAKAMKVPAGFEVTLFAGEPDVVQPIAMAFDDRGRLWVAEAYSYPIHVPEDKAKDRILIFEDKDNDGKFDKRTIFAEKLNLVSGLEIGFGGVWVGAAPYLLFIPDKDRDDQPDGPPQILLDGWGSHDSHETLNSFNWGPDGWLYGCHGVFTHSRVGKPGTPDNQRTPINAGIWRYHPTQHRFEVFSHGTSNPWGVDFDEHGQTFITACVIPHLYHMIDGARYERQAGPHFQPYTYDDIKTIADHRHYLGANPHGGNGRSDEAGGGHAHSGALIYLGGMWPEEYRGSLFMNNIHGARINRDLLVPEGSGFVGKHAPDFLLTNDRWSQIISLKYGPDGNVTMIDWYDKNQCHHDEVELHDRTNGRIFKVSYPSKTKAPTIGDLNALSSLELAKLELHPNEWYARHARRILQERGPDPELAGVLRTMATKEADPVKRLRALWSLYAIGGIDAAFVDLGLTDSSPDVRGWVIRLAASLPGADKNEAFYSKLEQAAKSDPSPIVRLALTSAIHRWPVSTRWAIVSGLLQHSEDANDHNLPLMIWYAAESLVEVDPPRAIKLASDAKIPLVREYLVRRVAALGSDAAIAQLIDVLGTTTDANFRLAILEGLNESLKGRRKVEMPAKWPAIFTSITGQGNAKVRAEATALALTFGDPAALETIRTILGDHKADLARRRAALADLLRVRDPKLAPTLQGLLQEPALRGQALRALAAYADPSTPGAVLKGYVSYTLPEKRDALNTLAARAESAKTLLAAVGDGKVPATDLSAEIIRLLRNHKDETLNAEIGRLWGTARDTSADSAKRIQQYKQIAKETSAEEPDIQLGRAVFAKTCQQCHTLFGVGGKVGPELTGSNRADLDYILTNILDPSALIGKDYLAQIVSTTDGRVLTGILKNEDRDSITLVSANDVLTIPKAEIEERKQSDKSMMPDDLVTPLSNHEFRSLVTYMASSNQVPLLATAENQAGFFNGRDLTGWIGDAKLWSVENGVIVGKTKGLDHNEFLRSDMSVGDFRLTLDVKLVANEGNSGIQFRSEATPEGIKGYQADVGAGWWGKLYEEEGRGLLWDKSGEEFIKLNDWNHYEIVAVGDRVRTYLNGHPCVVVDDPAGSKRGIFAFQLHAGGATEVRYKDIRLELNPKLPSKD
ncbi:PVC-type heme-binding CxxCH protein [Singulisphaera sp. PoT]|uniref:PVC-type heme-binding CxxCH protein n=1 Tax=Singulisphaera sp. PoT TaxID=3411797 RepID=UPI003BF579BF